MPSAPLIDVPKFDVCKAQTERNYVRAKSEGASFELVIAQIEFLQQRMMVIAMERGAEIPGSDALMQIFRAINYKMSGMQRDDNDPYVSNKLQEAAEILRRAYAKPRAMSG